MDKEVKAKSNELSKLQANLDKRIVEIENLQKEVKDKTDKYTQLQSDIMKVIFNQFIGVKLLGNYSHIQDGVNSVLQQLTWIHKAF